MSAIGGMLGPYPISRESSGSWQPELSPHDGVHGSAGGWSLMGHLNLFGVVIDQGGPRGDGKAWRPSTANVPVARSPSSA